MTRTAATRTTAAAPAAAPAAAFPMPELAKGEVYAGVLLKDGKPLHHLILLPGKKEAVNWQDAIAWAKKQGGELPTRKEQALLFANAAEHFQPSWYWSSQPYAGYDDYAWGQHFDDGDQNDTLKDAEVHARAVRRSPI